MGGLECQLVLGLTLAEEECAAESLVGEGLAEVGMRNLGRHLCWAEKPGKPGAEKPG